MSRFRLHSRSALSGRLVDHEPFFSDGCLLATHLPPIILPPQLLYFRVPSLPLAIHLYTVLGFLGCIGLDFESFPYFYYLQPAPHVEQGQMTRPRV